MKEVALILMVVILTQAEDRSASSSEGNLTLINFSVKYREKINV